MTPLGRLLEGGLVAASFAWHFARAHREIPHVGFAEPARPTARARARWAWDRTNGRYGR